MAMKHNCWEVKICGRQMGGDKVSEFGECPASRAFNIHGVHQGINGGRACWAIAGTFCGGKVQGVFAGKMRGCAECDFFHQALAEEGVRLVRVQDILSRLTENTSRKDT